MCYVQTPLNCVLIHCNQQANVSSTQEIVDLHLDSNRNALLALDLQVSIATLGIGTGALVAGLFGMNVRDGANFLCQIKFPDHFNCS